MTLVKKDVFVQEADVKSPTTGNLYPLAILENVVDSHPKRRLGELRGRTDEEIRTMNPEEKVHRFGRIALDNTSHAIYNLRIAEGKLICDIETMPTTRGRALEKLLNDPEQEPKVRFALRAFVNRDPDGTVTQMNLVTIDAVHP